MAAVVHVHLEYTHLVYYKYFYYSYKKGVLLFRPSCARPPSPSLIAQCGNRFSLLIINTFEISSRGPVLVGRRISRSFDTHRHRHRKRRSIYYVCLMMGKKELISIYNNFDTGSVWVCVRVYLCVGWFPSTSRLHLKNLIIMVIKKQFLHTRARFFHVVSFVKTNLTFETEFIYCNFRAPMSRSVVQWRCIRFDVLHNAHHHRRFGEILYQMDLTCVHFFCLGHVATICLICSESRF